MTRRRVPRLRLHKPTGQAVVTLNDRDLYLGQHGSQRAQDRYDSLIAEWLASGRNLPPSGGQKALTVSEVLLRYWRFAESYYRKGDRPTDELACLRSALRPVRRLFGPTPADEFGPVRLKAVRKAFLDSGWCRSYVNASVRRIKRVFKWAASEELVPPSVFHGLQAVSGLSKGRTGARETEGVKATPSLTHSCFSNLFSPKDLAEGQWVRSTVRRRAADGGRSTGTGDRMLEVA